MILFEESSPSLLVKYDTLYNNIKQIRTRISKKLDSFPLIMEKNTLFSEVLCSLKRENLLEWIQGVTEETGKNVSLKLVVVIYGI